MADAAAPDPDAHLKPWKLLHTEQVLETPWFTIDKQEMVTPAGAQADYYVHKGRDGIICVCVNTDGRIFVEKQYRPPVERVSYDYPAGNMEPADASPEAGIRRELREELGFEASSLERLASLDSNPGLSNTKVHVFLARGQVLEPPKPDDTESIVPLLVTPAEIMQLIKDGKIACTFCVSATFLAFQEIGLLKSSE